MEPHNSISCTGNECWVPHSSPGFGLEWETNIQRPPLYLLSLRAKPRDLRLSLSVAPQKKLFQSFHSTDYTVAAV